MAQRDFQTQVIRLGAGGLNLRPEVDVVPAHQLTRGFNHYRTFTGGLTARPGQEAFATSAGAKVHSIARMNKVLTGSFTRVWGIDSSLYYGAAGGLTLADAGYSGNPLTMIPGDPPIPGDPWIYVADSLRMRKIRIDGLDFIIGLPPGVLLTVVPTPLTLQNLIDDFEAADYSLWAGEGGGNVPSQNLIAGPVAGNALEFTTDPGAAAGEYSSLADKAVALDLSQYVVGAITVPSTDEDLVHFWARISAADSGAFILFLISGTFTPGVIPNEGFGNDSFFAYNIQTLSPTVWKEFGVPGTIVKKGDFTAQNSPDWANITGISIVFGMSTPSVGDFALDDWYMTPSTTPASSPVPYDYRVTNYDPRTGVEGNPSPIQAEGSFIDNLQNVVFITPQAFGDAAIRQRAYRRGGTLPDNWYLVGENTSDGGVIADTSSDASIEAAPTVQTDHDQPVTSQDSAGATVLAQPVPVIFGPVAGLYFGLGDANQPSTLYWCLTDRPDYWPATSQNRITAPSEFLQNGCVWGGEGYVSTPLGWYRLIPNLSDSSDVNVLPTGNLKGMATRWAMTVAQDGVHYLGNDGWYRHTGGPAENLSDTEMWSLFNGVTKNGVAPIDYAVPTQLRMGATLNEAWLQYQNTDGDVRHLILNLITREWRIADFGRPTAVMVGEAIGGGQMLTLLGGLADGVGYFHQGTADDGLPISVSGRTACLDQGAPRNHKQYGDVVASYTPNGIQVAVQAFLDTETVARPSQSLPTGGGSRRLEVLDPFGDTPVEGVNIALEFSWSTDAAPPVLDYLGPSYLLQPDTTVDRLTDWDDGGSPAEKLLKGVIFDVDTGGVNKEVLVEGTLYGGAPFTIATLTVNANGRRKLTFAWPATPATFIRLRPTDPTLWTRWAAQWIFDEQPLRLTRWETDQLTFGAEWTSCLYAYLCMQSTGVVTLTHTQYNEAGVPTITTYPLASTAGVRKRFRQTFEAGKGVLHKFVFAAAAPFLLFREESHLMIKPWGGENLIRHPWGNDDLSLTRGMQSSEGTALTPGGGDGSGSAG